MVDAMYAAVIVVIIATTLFTLFVRAKDIPAPDPVSPTQHLDERKAAIYENLRDLQFEYRVGKLSDADYQSTKLSLQKELAVVLAEIDKVTKSVAAKASEHAPEAVRAHAERPGHPTRGHGSAAAVAERVAVAEKTAATLDCPHCGAKFSHAMKFCGECGKAMAS